MHVLLLKRGPADGLGALGAFCEHHGMDLVTLDPAVCGAPRGQPDDNQVLPRRCRTAVCAPPQPFGP